MNTSAAEETLIAENPSYSQVTAKIAGLTERKTPRYWYFVIAITGSLALIFIGSIVHLILTGLGIWGINIPVAWGFAIVNFVFWVGIGHAGTLISAILFLLRQKWRTSINRFAEAMTLMAIACAGIFPAIHVGRIWVLYWMFPVPNQMGVWPNFRSPLLWDVFAVSTYFICSLLFWYIGLIPDLATLRDRAHTRTRQVIYGFLALGWRGGIRQWRHYELAYLILAGISTPLVLSVHSIVSTDFAVSVLPGWHTTIFPPYFVVGAIFSGFAMVTVLAIVLRRTHGLQEYITLNHLDKMSKIMLVTSLMIGYCYGIEFFTAWYSGNEYEIFTFLNRATGPYAWAYWVMIICNVVIPQLLWFSKVRRNVPALLTISLLITVGMWFERFVIVVTSLSRDFLPSSWGSYAPTIYDLALLAGSFGFFLTLFFLFARFLPVIAMSEVKAVLPAATATAPSSLQQ